MDKGKFKSITFEMWLREDGIVVLRWKPKVELKLAQAQESFEVFTSITSGKKSPLLVDTAAVQYYTREFREYYVSEAVSQTASAVALLVGSPLTRTMANFFLSVSKPRIPTRMFDSEAAAIKWLKEFIT
ncbi:MAG: hypothetical protein Q7T89_04540 [Anaerolineales bacterium]|nr:hypothetical protein [Anaerolineales bacterium]